MKETITINKITSLNDKALEGVVGGTCAPDGTKPRFSIGYIVLATRDQRFGDGVIIDMAYSENKKCWMYDVKFAHCSCGYMEDKLMWFGYINEEIREQYKNNISCVRT